MDNVICSMCKINVDLNDHGYVKDHLSVDKRWGYGTRFDNEIHSITICEDCYGSLIDEGNFNPKIINKIDIVGSETN